MIACPALTPRGVWAMRADEGLGYCLAKAALIKRGQAKQRSEKAYEDRPDGTRVFKIDSMEKLYSFVGSGGLPPG